MILHTGLQAFWFWYISAVFLVFFLLDGFDMGIGMLLPFLSKHRNHRKTMLDVIWPFWDGNELWALIGAALLFTVFPKAFAMLLGSFSPVAAVLLVFLILRTVSFEAWYHDRRHERFWEYAQAAGSLALAFGTGLVYGNLLAGLPMTADGILSGMPWAAFQPFALLTGVLSAAAALSHGALYIRRKTTGELRGKVMKLSGKLQPILAGLGALVFVLMIVLDPTVARRPLFWLGGAGALACGTVSFLFRKRESDHSPFFWSALTIVFYWLAGGAALFPYILRPKNGSAGLALNAVANVKPTLEFIAVFSIIALVITGGYTVFVYRVFKGKAEADHSQTS